MKHIIDETLISIFKSILGEGRSLDEWAEVESDDMFQKEPYIGGYDADEEAFCFSYFGGKSEYWFQVTMSEILSMVDGHIKEVVLTEADL